jgi:hypothetical protein
MLKRLALDMSPNDLPLDFFQFIKAFNLRDRDQSDDDSERTDVYGTTYTIPLPDNTKVLTMIRFFGSRGFENASVDSERGVRIYQKGKLMVIMTTTDTNYLKIWMGKRSTIFDRLGVKNFLRKIGII